MKTTKVLSALLAGVMCMSCFTSNVFAAANADDYESFTTNISSENIEKWNDIVHSYIVYDEPNIDTDAVTFSEVYCVYDFYSLKRDENSYCRIIFENNEVIGVTSVMLGSGYVCPQYSLGNFDYVADALENDGKILFGRAIINSLPCGLIYADGVFYNYNSAATEIGATDLVFGEIPYSQTYWENTPDDADGTLITYATTVASATEPADVMPGIPGDVNLDGKTSLADAVHTNLIMSGIVKVSDQQMELADCYADGIVNASDVNIIVKYIIEEIAELPYIPE